MKYYGIFFLLLSSLSLFGQVKSVEELDSKYLNWYNKDYSSDKIVGTSIEKAYELLGNNTVGKKTVIVAVIDGGVDINHEDLQSKIWVNEDEIPGNGLDDDKNGYVDDIYGWNFIGNTEGENIHYENLEYTRIVRKNNSEDPDLEAAKSIYDEKLAEYTEQKEDIAKFANIYYKAKAIIKQKTGRDISNLEEVMEVVPTDQQTVAAKKFLKERYTMGFTEEGLMQLVNHNKEFLDYHLNLDFTPRMIAGDNPEDLNDRNYGNPDVTGPEASHGTSVAGVIAAVRGNGIGIDGVATNVKIMAIRSTPSGDERDKDVALAIMYAVDNGADIINMSFGKEFSPQKEFVDQAVRYAEEKGVLMIHASGNSGIDIDVKKRYPSNIYLDNTRATHWMNVGASAFDQDENLAAIFSNYGKENVDIFAPGVEIMSTDTSSTYSMHDGTSLAAPVVSGVAALVWSHYPELTPQEMIEILNSSVYKVKSPKKVLIPDLESEKRDKVRFTDLSISGGIVNAYKALQLAEEHTSKRSAESKAPIE